MSHQSKIFIQIGIALACAALALLVPLYFTTSKQAVLIVKHFTYSALGATCLLFLLQLRESLKEVARARPCAQSQKPHPGFDPHSSGYVLSTPARRPRLKKSSSTSMPLAPPR